MVQGRELARRDGGRREAGAVSDHQPEPFRHRSDLRRQQDRIRRRRVERHQHPVEAAPFVGLGEQAQVVPVDHRAGSRVDL
jgi:hypothetical protein